MTNYDLINKYIEGVAIYGATNHLAFNHNKLFSYSTLICTIDRKKKNAVVNTRKYTRTTSKQLTTLLSVLHSHGYKIDTYEGEACYLWNCGYQGAPTMTISDAMKLA